MDKKNILSYNTQDVLSAIKQEYDEGELIDVSYNNGKLENHYIDRNTGKEFIVVQDLN